MGQWPRSLSGRDDDDGAQISFGDDHRWPGVARERLLSRFFFFSLLYFLRCRHRSGGNENLIGGVFVHSRIVLHHFVIANAKERKRRNMRDGQRGQAWTVWTYQPPIDMCCAQWETFSGPLPFSYVVRRGSWENRVNRTLVMNGTGLPLIKALLDAWRTLRRVSLPVCRATHLLPEAIPAN